MAFGEDFLNSEFLNTRKYFKGDPTIFGDMIDMPGINFARDYIFSILKNVFRTSLHSFNGS